MILARNLDAKCRKCRREGEKLFLKGEKCFTDKCAVERRAYPPGQHGQRRNTRLSEYGGQLREKQKVKRIYGLFEKQFRSYFAKATRKKGITGSILLQFLERRIDNVIFQAGYCTSRRQARQLVGHGYVYVNDRKVNIPSFLVKDNDEVAVRFTTKGQQNVKDNIELTKDRSIPGWLEVDKAHFKAKVVRLPQREDIGFPVNEQLIVELYSR